jgi:hypothetical protein
MAYEPNDRDLKPFHFMMNSLILTPSTPAQRESVPLKEFGKESFPAQRKDGFTAQSD